VFSLTLTFPNRFANPAATRVEKAAIILVKKKIDPSFPSSTP
jgi:hypothetical protein